MLFFLYFCFDWLIKKVDCTVSETHDKKIDEVGVDGSVGENILTECHVMEDVQSDAANRQPRGKLGEKTLLELAQTHPLEENLTQKKGLDGKRSADDHGLVQNEEGEDETSDDESSDIDTEEESSVGDATEKLEKKSRKRKRKGESATKVCHYLPMFLPYNRCFVEGVKPFSF